MRRLAVVPFLIITTVALAQPQQQPSERAAEVRAHYTKYEYRIPMRDGVRLFTSVFVPKDASRSYPFLMTRTPYSVAPYGEDQYPPAIGPSMEFEKSGYIFVRQDVRGRYMSEGDFLEMHPHVDQPKTKNDVDESTDMYDTVEWLLKNVPNNNGRVGIWGISYPGFYTSASIIDSHPAIKAASPEAPMTDLFMSDDAYHGGAFMLSANFGFYWRFRPRSRPETKAANINLEPVTNDAYEFYRKLEPLSNAERDFFKGGNPLWDDQIKHDTYDDYWKARDLSRHMHGIKCAVLTVGGWFDAEDLSGPFKTFHSIEEKNKGIYNGLVVGPWVHGGWARWQGAHLGRVAFADNTGEFYRTHILFPFFEQYLKDALDAKLPKAYVFETGTNVWRKYASWPPEGAQQKTLYLHAGGRLSFEAPSAGEAQFDEYVSDPAHPVPYVGYTSPPSGVPQEYMVSDQRFASRRPDVLAYVSEPLENDVTIAGPVAPHLRVSSSGTDSDFVVKLIDVYPYDLPDEKDERATPPRDVQMPTESMGGYQQLIRGEPMRAKFYRSWEKPQALPPNQVIELNFEMPDVNHTFRKGHRIMVQVQSSWFPLIDLNPQTFTDVPNAKPEDFKKATERVYHSAQQASGVVVQVLGR
jgi:putative CocE/NonD family hydrolase